MKKLKIDIERIIEVANMTTKQQNDCIIGIIKDYPEVLPIFQIAANINTKAKPFLGEVSKSSSIRLPIVFQTISDLLGYTGQLNNQMAILSTPERLLVELAINPRTFRLSTEQLINTFGNEESTISTLLKVIPEYITSAKVTTNGVTGCAVCGNSSTQRKGNICYLCSKRLITFCNGRNYGFTIQKNRFNFKNLKASTSTPIKFKYLHWEFTNKDSEIEVTPTGIPNTPLELPLEFYEYVKQPIVLT